MLYPYFSGKFQRWINEFNNFEILMAKENCECRRSEKLQIQYNPCMSERRLKVDLVYRPLDCENCEAVSDYKVDHNP